MIIMDWKDREEELTESLRPVSFVYALEALGNAFIEGESKFSLHIKDDNEEYHIFKALHMEYIECTDGKLFYYKDILAREKKEDMVLYIKKNEKKEIKYG